jgi:glycosyltransferase involved in cell wall biosynthesis
MAGEQQMRPRLLILIAAYNAQGTLGDVVARIPRSLTELVEVEILVIDDCSQDATLQCCHELESRGAAFCPLHVLSNAVNQGYGGTQKIGYRYALREGFDAVALLHGDGQYAPECLPELIAPVIRGEADAVFGSRMLVGGAALRGGMPLYKFVGNHILTALQNALMRSRLSEFHSGYRIYSVAALGSIPFELNAQGFHFDTEIIIQLMIARRTIRELAIPTFYGDEICYVNGLGYAWNVMKQTCFARLQMLHLCYDRKYDCAPPAGGSDTVGAQPRG